MYRGVGGRSYFGRLRGGSAKLAFIGREHCVIFLYVRLIFQAPTLLRIIAKSLESLLCSTLGEHNFLSYLQLDVLVVFTGNLFSKCFFVVFCLSGPF